MLSDALRTNLAPLVVRLVLGVIFVYHGWDKVNAKFGTEWDKGAPAKLKDKEIVVKERPPLPVGMQIPVAWGELIGGIAFIVGFWNRLAAAGIIIIMLGGITTVHYPNGFDIRQNGYEYNIALIAMCIVLILIGSGPLSLDRLLQRRKPA